MRHADYVRMVAESVQAYEGLEINGPKNFNPGPGVVKMKSDTTGGTSAVYLIRRLVRDHPEIAKRMANGEFASVRAAAIEAGVMPRTQTVRIDSAAAVARTLRRHMSRECLAELITLLSDNDD